MAIDKDRILRRAKNRLARTEKRAGDIASVGEGMVASKRRKTLASAIGMSKVGQKVIGALDERTNKRLDKAGATDEEKNEIFSLKQKRRARKGIWQGGVFNF